MNVPFSSPSEAYFLELGILPLGVIIKTCRLNYLYYIMNREESEKLYRFFMTHWNNEVFGDWTKKVRVTWKSLEYPATLNTSNQCLKVNLKTLLK